ncbi:MAG TPA: site-2 protease family protein [Thermoanaerobaculia bacterium]|jgi:Zn-dependent protease/CBS domain-containing protein
MRAAEMRAAGGIDRIELEDRSPTRTRHPAARLGRVFGIDIEVDPSWYFIFVLVTWNLAAGFAQLHPSWGTALQIATAVSASLLFFASVLAHELAHSLVARRRGLPVHRITLFLFGGISNLEQEPSSPGVEFVMAVVGPVTSVLLGFVFLLLGAGSAGGIGAALGNPMAAAARLTPLASLLLWLGPINVLVGLFNLVPAFPLDGGRILRSLLWAGTKDLRKATRWAAQIGGVIAWIFIFAGIAMVFGARIPFFGAGLIGGLWLALIGWFLRGAAAASYGQLVVYDLLEGVPVSRLMRRDTPTVPSDIPVSELVDRFLLGTDERAFPVVDGSAGSLAGLVCLDDVRRLPRPRWDQTLVRDIMTPVERLTVIPQREDAAQALREITRLDVRQIPVVDGARLVGLLRRRDFVRWLHLQSGAPAA